MKAAIVAKQLKIAGFIVESFEEADADADGEVVLSDAIHVQVGADYLSVVEFRQDGTFLFHDYTDSISTIIDELREIIK